MDQPFLGRLNISFSKEFLLKLMPRNTVNVHSRVKLKFFGFQVGAKLVKITFVAVSKTLIINVENDH